MDTIRKQLTYTIELFQVADEIANEVITCMEDIPEQLIYEMFGNIMMSHEEIHAIYLTNAKKIRFTEQIAVGGTTSCIMSFDKLITTMAQQRTPNLILIHNHPSGHPQFSAADRHLYNRCNEICKVLGYQMLDFLMVDTDFKLHSMRKW